MAAAREPWWIIGSAAVALHAPQVADVGDVDVLMGAGDAEAVLQSLGAERLEDEPHALFRSSVFGVWRGPPLAVDIMAGLSLFTGTGWAEVRPVTRQRFEVAGRDLFAPSAVELRDILLSFGRPKDLARARLLWASTTKAHRPGQPSGTS